LGRGREREKKEGGVDKEKQEFDLTKVVKIEYYAFHLAICQWSVNDHIGIGA
jgi:hypothetical protein